MLQHVDAVGIVQGFTKILRSFFETWVICQCEVKRTGCLRPLVVVLKTEISKWVKLTKKFPLKYYVFETLGRKK